MRLFYYFQTDWSRLRGLHVKSFFFFLPSHPAPHEWTSTGDVDDDDDEVHSPYYKYKVVKNTIPRRDMNINDQYQAKVGPKRRGDELASRGAPTAVSSVSQQTVSRAARLYYHSTVEIPGRDTVQEITRQRNHILMFLAVLIVTMIPGTGDVEKLLLGDWNSMFWYHNQLHGLLRVGGVVFCGIREIRAMVMILITTDWLLGKYFEYSRTRQVVLSAEEALEWNVARPSASTQGGGAAGWMLVGSSGRRDSSDPLNDSNHTLGSPRTESLSVFQSVCRKRSQAKKWSPLDCPPSHKRSIIGYRLAVMRWTIIKRWTRMRRSKPQKNTGKVIA